MLTVITPAFNEAANLAAVHQRLAAALRGLEWEWIVVDDHSVDATFAVAADLARQDPRISGFRWPATADPMRRLSADWITRAATRRLSWRPICKILPKR